MAARGRTRFERRGRTRFERVKLRRENMAEPGLSAIDGHSDMCVLQGARYRCTRNSL